MRVNFATRMTEQMAALLAERKYRFFAAGLVLALTALVLGSAVARSAVMPFLGGSIPFFVVLCLAAGVCLVLLLGPSYLMCGAFLLVMLSGHESLSFVIVDAMGVEWHLREFFLGLLLCHAALQALRLRVVVVDSPIHSFMICYGLFFLMAALVGIFYLDTLSPLLGEIRFALFVLSYVAFLVCMSDPREVRIQICLAGWILALIALASIVFFLWAMCIHGPVSFQNEWGAFIQRAIRGWQIQTVRSNGHFFFESALVVCSACLFVPSLSRKHRSLLLLANLLFLVAIVITGMRTAYITTLIGLGAWGVIALPPKLRLAIVAIGMTSLLLLLVFASALLSPADVPDASEFGVSLRARIVESQGAWTVFTQYPLLGGGLGASFEALGLVAKKADVSYAMTEYDSLHNYWLYFLFKGGICGFVLAAVGLFGLIGYGIRIACRQESAIDRALIQGMTAALIGQYVASLTMARLYYPVGQVFVAFVAATFYVFGSAYRRGQAPSLENRPKG